jgi:preprotein translocase subunit SecA
MDHLKEGIGLRGYGQKDPLVEYKKESYDLYEALWDRIEDETVRYLYFLRFEQNPGTLPFNNEDSEYEEDEAAEEQRKLEVARQVEEQQRLAAQSAVQDMTRNIQKQHERELKELQFAGTNGSGTANQTVANGGPKVGRNDPCPCGSGKKYKKCHGA